MKGRFFAITDPHFALSSNTRTGDLLEDLMIKFDWSINYANEHDLILLASGDIFDKPSVPDIVKSRLIKSLRLAKYRPIFIKGNHDRLYASDDYMEKTSYNLILETQLLQDCTDVTYEFDDCVVTSQRPLLNNEHGKPIINLWHGFLNKEDGLSTFMLEDIISDTNNLIILGHDHIPYEPVMYKNSLIYRPGSFCRAIRNDSADRIPVGLKIHFEDGKPVVEEVPIVVAKQVELLFKNKVATQQKTTVEDYTDIVNLLNTRKKGVTLFDALAQVTNPEIINHIKNILDD